MYYARQFYSKFAIELNLNLIAFLWSRDKTKQSIFVFENIRNTNPSFKTKRQQWSWKTLFTWSRHHIHGPYPTAKSPPFSLRIYGKNIAYESRSLSISNRPSKMIPSIDNKNVGGVKEGYFSLHYHWYPLFNSVCFFYCRPKCVVLGNFVKLR